MIDKTKSNGVVGKEVHEYLVKKGVETPFFKSNYSNAEKINQLTELYRKSMEIMGLDLSNDSLMETPARRAKMEVNELFVGLDYEYFPKATVVQNSMHYDEMVLEKDIKVASFCEHHHISIWGKAHIAYVPDEKVIGLSKMNRIVNFFSRRPQIQERLTQQIYYALSYLLDTENVAVVIEADHFCVKQRGAEDVNSSTITSKLGGKFLKEPDMRAEFMSLIRGY